METTNLGYLVPNCEYIHFLERHDCIGKDIRKQYKEKTGMDCFHSELNKKCTLDYMYFLEFMLG
jgi:hypothetical protein